MKFLKKENVTNNTSKNEEFQWKNEKKDIFSFLPSSSSSFSSPSFSPPVSYFPSSFSSSSYYTFINDVLDNTGINDVNSSDNNSNNLPKVSKNGNEIYANYPLLFNSGNTIKVPSKIEYVLRRFTPKAMLKEIHPNIDVSVELCLLFTTLLNSTYFKNEEVSHANSWKRLKADYLRVFISIHPQTYKRVREALETPLLKGAILECKHDAIPGNNCNNHRFGEAYFGKGVVNYTLKTKEAQKLLNKKLTKSYSLAMNNPIGKNLIQFYSKITLPTLEEIMLHAKELVKNNHITKKGKELKFLNKHAKSYYKNPENYSFVEDGIKRFKYLTENGYMIPRVGSKESGGRIVDSIVLMNRWIRDLIRIDGELLDECDYSCLHPNIAMHLYSGTKIFLTHEEIAEQTNIPIKIVKTEHLSFFNKHPKEMAKSPLYEYYQDAEPTMMRNLINEKNKQRYKITSRRMFETEVEIMTNVIIKLNEEGIFVGYAYDALFCQSKHSARVKEVMNSIILLHGVKTTAKLESEKEKKSIQEKDIKETIKLPILYKPLPDSFGYSANC